MTKQIIFVDSAVQDYQTLINSADTAQIFILNENLSGIEQITNTLALQSDIEAIHILSHGSPGTLHFGSETLSNKNLAQWSNKIKQWGKALTKNADILLYGCNVAAKETGLQFIQKLHQLTGANVAASNNKTGNQAAGGDWELEVKIGNIATQPLNVPNYSYTLPPTGAADNKALLVSGAPTSTQINVLANDTGTGRLNVQSIAIPPTNGTAIINDGIYVGGYFTNIGGVARNRIARLNSDGTVDPAFNPNANSLVFAIAIDSSGNPYVGGDFTNIGGSTRNYIAKLNPTTGAADATFNPNANGGVFAIAIDSSGNPIVGGVFTSIGGSARNRIAKLNPTTGVADATFNPSANNPVLAIAIDSSGNPIVGGFFTNIGGSTRNNIAKLNPTTGVADATFNPNADNLVYLNSIAIDPKRDILYTPNANFNGVDSFTYTANDSTGPGSATTVSVLVNNSPVLDTSGTPTLTAQNQGDSASTGTLVSTIITNLGGTKITDPNTAALQGIAITGLDTANGTWQYTINNGTTWTNTPAVSATNALLLASTLNTRIRFVPNATYNGTVANAITFAAWDQIGALNGSTANYTADRTTNTTSSVFSSATETANITVNPPPTITSVTPVANGTYGVGQNLDFTVTFNQAVTITQGTGSAILPITLDTGGTVNATLVGTGASNTTQIFRYTVASGNLDTNGIAVGTALTLSGGATIQNAIAVNAILTLNSVGATTAVLVDGVLPTVTSITSTTTDGTYTVGQIIPITVSFSEPVTVTGIPQLTLATGGAGTPINYASGTGTTPFPLEDYRMRL